ncbi:hypothetical protein [Methyloparacoccus murrellii]
MHRFLRRQGLPVHYSAFTARRSARKLARCPGVSRAAYPVALSFTS